MSEQIQANQPRFTEKVIAGRFQGKTIIVTGAGSGIGRAVALRAAREGAQVVAADWDGSRLEALVAEYPVLNFVPVQGDVGSQEDVDKVVAAAGGKVDALANIAGVMDRFQPVGEVTDDVWERVFRVNVWGLMRMTRGVIPIMMELGGGNIVNTASVAGVIGAAAGAAYTASKHAVVGITRNTAFMYAPNNIRCNAVAPGGVQTNIGGDFASNLAMARMGPRMEAIVPPMAQPEELAAVITFLLSHDSPNINGAVIPSDGGWTAS